MRMGSKRFFVYVSLCGLLLFGSATLYAQTVGFAYFAGAVNGDARNVWAYAIDRTTGNLSAVTGSPFALDGSLPTERPAWLMADPSRRFVYTTMVESGNLRVFTFRINLSTGALTQVGPPAGINGAAITEDPLGQFAYVGYTDLGGTDFIEINNVDATSGALTPRGQISSSACGSTGPPSSLAVDNAGQYLYATVGTSPGGVLGFSADAATGDLTPISGCYAAGPRPVSVALDPFSRFLYVANFTSDTITGFLIDALTGQLSSAGTFSAGSTPVQVVTDTSGSFLYATRQQGSAGTIVGYRIEQTTGSLSPVPGFSFATGDFPKGLATDPNGRFVYIAARGGVTAYRIDPDNGSLTPLPGVSLPGAEFEFVAITGVP